MRIALALLLVLAGSPLLAERSLAGRTVTFRVLTFDNPADPLFRGRGVTVTTGEGVEFGLDREGAQNGVDVVPVRIDIAPTRIAFDYAQNAPGAFLAARFNGYELSFPTECAVIEAAHVRMDETTLPISDANLTVEPQRLLLNVQGLEFGPSSRIVLDIAVGDCPLS